jgi:hypothetical protein
MMNEGNEFVRGAKKAEVLSKMRHQVPWVPLQWQHCIRKRIDWQVIISQLDITIRMPRIADQIVAKMVAGIAHGDIVRSKLGAFRLLQKIFG